MVYFLPFDTSNQTVRDTLTTPYVYSPEVAFDQGGDFQLCWKYSDRLQNFFLTTTYSEQVFRQVFQKQREHWTSTLAALGIKVDIPMPLKKCA